ncbi:MAG: hypothetical protein RMX68_021520 [Aulosira sp. ZfuVER01]|nr:hypothetical protein [Aulosira sp. ZfuVER01]MDZ8002706.1 hypothetical protein [Aulosira sp. DedVER01a]MDZ8050616.1 hypothetical protein [Aulosira sp. ZfuCHP01]
MSSLTIPLFFIGKRNGLREVCKRCGVSQICFRPWCHSDWSSDIRTSVGVELSCHAGNPATTSWNKDV